MHRLKLRTERWLRSGIGQLALMGGILDVVGIVLLIWGQSKGYSILQTAGALVFGSGLTVTIATITGRQSVQDQNAKEANLRRKQEVYGPLHAEIKAFYERLEQARNGMSSYPSHIIVAWQVGENLSSNNAIFTNWPTFKADYRADDFTPRTQKLLNEILTYVNKYNDVLPMLATPLEVVFGRYIEEAIHVTEKSVDYQKWRQKQGLRITSPTQSSDDEDWFRRVEDERPSDGRARGPAWARAWFAPGRSLVVEWLLAGLPDRAAESIHQSYTYGGNPPPPREWIANIVDVAWPIVDNQSMCKQTRTVFLDLLRLTRNAEDVLEQGLREIQDRYEGGPPPV